MPSQLVDDVLRLIRRRTEEGHPLTMPERALLLATILPTRTDGDDVVDELEAAIAQARTVLLGVPPANLTPAAVEASRRSATRRLLAAARAVLDHAPRSDEFDPAATMPEVARGGRPHRQDIDA